MPTEVIITTPSKFNCTAEWHMARMNQPLASALYNFALYLAYKSPQQLAEGEEPIFWPSCSTLAEYFNVHEKTIRRTLHGLRDEGFLVLVKPKELGQPRRYRPVNHGEWAKTHPGRCVKRGAKAKQMRSNSSATAKPGLSPAKPKFGTQESVDPGHGSPSDPGHACPPTPDTGVRLVFRLGSESVSPRSEKTKETVVSPQPKQSNSKSNPEDQDLYELCSSSRMTDKVKTPSHEKIKTETIGDHFAELTIEALTEGELDEDYLAKWVWDQEYRRILAECMQEAVATKASRSYCGLTTNAQLMGDTMKILRDVHGKDVPRAWYPVMKSLREASSQYQAPAFDSRVGDITRLPFDSPVVQFAMEVNKREPCPGCGARHLPPYCKADANGNVATAAAIEKARADYEKSLKHGNDYLER